MKTQFVAASLAASACLLLSSQATAISVGNNLLGGATTQHEYQTDYAAWFVADLSDPVTPAHLPITSNSTAGRWTQELTVGAGFPVVETGDVFLLQELLAVGDGDFPIQNWHQDVLSPNWQWIDGSIFDDDTAEPLPGLIVTPAGSHIGFDFDPLEPGTELFLAAYLEYIGPAGIAPFPLTVQAFTVVPEPNSLAALSLGMAGWAIRRRRSRIAKATFA